MGMLDHLRRRLRGSPAAAPSLVGVARAIAFGEAADAQRVAERLEQQRAGEEQAERERHLRKASVAAIRDEIVRHGAWFPPGHEFERWR